ncbi:hypothetical protein [Akkermansia glycaniphila]|uniref:Prokaryotic membrane lipoprotein lipid attachment site profile n=1 Tax=Akkermansia glycaniphila TaxID=1679444 RepID=A0A1C7P8W8_9BACT|nr:hypothetical protein [Akkermansia glycaniphila]MBT9450431.1 hypothetical protein [Akkermansia glycaniphila]OCA02021.1 hypothetical protein AC781_12560 [Akkermansia glycaniphila]SEH93375.1 Hypothetical protein PYTT_1836 [Akkermansia glycaniphila]
MKTTFAALIAATGILLCASCQSTPRTVPDNGRVVVEPRGTEGNTKPWNTIQKAEGDAQLGPLSNMRR